MKETLNKKKLAPVEQSNTLSTSHQLLPISRNLGAARVKPGSISIYFKKPLRSVLNNSKLHHQQQHVHLFL
jgi:hypothetical protein